MAHFHAISSLILKRGAASRPSGEWNDDDYDVLADFLDVAIANMGWL